MKKCYPYNDIDGNHWPDADLGDALFYSIDFADWIEEENDSFISATWTTPEGIEASDDYVASKEAFIKLKPLWRGSFKMVCELVTTENGKEQTRSIPMVLKVY